MSDVDRFFKQPILNSPYERPSQHWEFDKYGQPTYKIINSRRVSSYLSPIPPPRKILSKSSEKQLSLKLSEDQGLSTDEQEYDPTPMINEIRAEIEKWRTWGNEESWLVTPTTALLLNHWRHHKFNIYRPFYCQLEAVETVIWLTEVAPRLGQEGRRFLKWLEDVNESANPGLSRLALKMATGAGKTTVMAMLIAWQTLNAVRHGNTKKFTRGFLVVTPGITIRDRLRVLFPNDPDAYYKDRELVPDYLVKELEQAKIIITNYHAFRLREKLSVSKTGRSLLQGRDEPIRTFETEGQMLQRVLSELMSMKAVMVLNDEAHHCYREKPTAAMGQLKGEEREEAEKNNEAARLWISGLEILQRKKKISRIIDLSATPYFLSGSGFEEGTLFPWTMSDFSLLDAIECGIVKAPRVPVSDNIAADEMPKFRNLWVHIKSHMPKKGRSKSNELDPLNLPIMLQTALDSLYGHYRKTFDLWVTKKTDIPPCFIVVCNNTSTSKLLYDYISGFHRINSDGSLMLENGRLELFRNFDENGVRLAIPRTILIDSAQLETGDMLDSNFREMAADEIERFRHEIAVRTGDRIGAENISDQDLLREVMNTVGKKGRLGESIRCVVSVSMLTEGWDAGNVTHILGIRAFSTQLLCEQVVGRALRRQSYDTNEAGLYTPEYADILGVPFDFAAKPAISPPQPRPEVVLVQAISPDRDDLTITFPRVQGYRIELPEERLSATFNEESKIELTPELVGPTENRDAGIIGETADLTLQHLESIRPATLVFNLTKHLLYRHWRDPGDEPKLHLFGQLKAITMRWLNECLTCKGGTFSAMLMYTELADIACQRITAAITKSMAGDRPIKAALDPYHPVGSTHDVRFNTSKKTRMATDPRKCHINYLVYDSAWEAELGRVLESIPAVEAYVKNHALGLEIPYQYGTTQRMYRPDFIARVTDGSGRHVHIILEVKGQAADDDKVKRMYVENYWAPGVNNLGKYGKWAFAELRDVNNFKCEVTAKINEVLGQTDTSNECRTGERR